MHPDPLLSPPKPYPAGSVKDRPALSMIAQAEARGDISPGDTLIEAALTDGQREIVLATKLGKAIRFEEARARPMGRVSTGVIGEPLPHGKITDVIDSPLPKERPLDIRDSAEFIEVAHRVREGLRAGMIDA